MRTTVSTLVAAAVAAIVTVSAGGLWAHETPLHGPKPDKKAIDLAGDCVLAGMAAGLATTWTADALADYCVAAATIVVNADYTP